MQITSTLGFIMAGLLALQLCGCEDKGNTGTAPDRSRTSASASSAQGRQGTHGVPGAKPGSHGDWCGAHDVPESQCTRCNPSLIPAFKASSDWCAPHNLPESQCLICNPDLKIVRPPESAKDEP